MIEILRKHRSLGERCDDFVADRGLDSGKTKAPIIFYAS